MHMMVTVLCIYTSTDNLKKVRLGGGGGVRGGRYQRSEQRRTEREVSGRVDNNLISLDALFS